MTKIEQVTEELGKSSDCMTQRAKDVFLIFLDTWGPYKLNVLQERSHLAVLRMNYIQ